MIKTKEQWEEILIESLIQIRDHFLEQPENSILGATTANVVEDIIRCYFEERRKRVPIQICSSMMNFEDAAEFINDKVLAYIFDEKAELLTIDWRQLYILKTEETEFFNDSEYE